MAKPPHLGEFERIARYFAPLAGEDALGLKDDAALIAGPNDTQLVLTADALIEGVHFLPTDPPRDIAQKLLRVNLSDLAAKGARPQGYLLTLALPSTHDEAWLAEFSAGLAADQKQYGIALLGGDSSRIDGPAALSLAAIGTVDAGRAVLRSGAKAGDWLYVSGTLGDAALGLKVLRSDLTVPDPAHRDHLVSRYRLPQPRTVLGRHYVGLAAAAIDISDGLVADLGHLCEASGVAGVIETARLPLSDAARAALAADPALVETVLTGGDDYELLFTAMPTASGAVAELARHLGEQVTEIGRIEAGRGVTVLSPDGSALAVGKGGYSHF
jgi:thiamine-monophosphate kinase